MNNTVAIVRQLKIDMITDQPNSMLEWFNDVWFKLQIIETNVYHDLGGEYIYFMDNDDTKQWIFFQDNKNDRFWCNYNNYWSILETNYNIKYTDIQAITRLLVENALNNEVASPVVTGGFFCHKVENALNNEVATPEIYMKNHIYHVENALNNEIATPNFYRFKRCTRVENALNNEVATPVAMNGVTEKVVENALNNTINE